jgi:hypothetical protein
MNQHRLHSRLSGDPHANMPVGVMIIGEHHEYLLVHEECRLPMRELFGHARQGCAKPADAAQVFFGDGRVCGRHLKQHIETGG